MEALIDNGEEWMEPLLDFREWLVTTTEPERKHEFRDIKGRDGRVVFKKDGTLAARTYKLDVSKEMLRKVLQAQKSVRENGPDPNITLISEEELYEIRRLWRVERQDWEDSVPKIFREVNNADLKWPVDDDDGFDSGQQALLSSLCKEHDLPFDLLARLLEVERQSTGLARRAGIQKALNSVLSQEWGNEADIIYAAKEKEKKYIQLRLVKE